MDRLKDLYARCAQGKAQIVLVDGAVASGKTELLHAFGERVVESDGVLLTAVGSRVEPTVAFDALGQLFLNSKLPDDTREAVAALLTEYGARADDDATAYTGAARAGRGTATAGAAHGDTAADTGPPGPDADSPSDEPSSEDQPAAGDALPAVTGAMLRIGRSLCDVLLDLCARQPVVIGVDDVQHVDEATLDILLYLLRRLRTSRLMVILNEWTGPRPAHPSFRAELLRRPDCHRIQLHLLTPAEVAGALSDRLDPAAAARLSAGYHAVSGGNPLLLHGLVDDSATALPDGTRTLSAEPVPDESFRQAVFGCLYRWDTGTIDVARGLAVLGRQATPALIGRLTGLESERVRQGLDALTKSGLLERGWYRHDFVREVVMDSLDAGRRPILHQGAARLLHDSGLPASDVARHVLAAGQVRESWAVSVLQDAATHALAEDRLEFALECLESAQRACDDPRQRAALTMTLTRVEWRNHPSAAARHLTGLRQSLAAGHLGPQHGATLIRYLVWHGRGAEALDTYQWLMRSQAPRDPAIAADLRLVHSWLEPVRCDGVLSEPAAIPSVDGTGGRVHGGLVSAAAFGSVLHQGPNERAVEQAEQVLASCTLSDESLMAVRSALYTLIHADRADKAKPWCQIFVSQARARRSASWEALLSGLRAEAAAQEGDLADAEHWARRSLDLLPPHDWGVFIGLPLSVLVRAQTGLGRYDDAAATLRQLVPESMFRGRWAVAYLHARGHYFLATARAQAALADFRKCGELMTGWSMDSPVLVPWRSDIAQAQLQLGEPEQARALLEEQLALPTGSVARVRGVSLRVLARTREPEERPALLREAVDLLQAVGDAMALLLALADLSLAHRELGDLNMGRMLERRVLRLARECGAEEHFRQVFSGPDGARDGDGGRRPDLMVVLSDAERRVAELAARGHTNRQISRKLYITVSTVEQHLTRVYRKLNVTRRADLPPWLKEEDDEMESPRLMTADGLALPRPKR